MELTGTGDGKTSRRDLVDLGSHWHPSATHPDHRTRVFPTSQGTATTVTRKCVPQTSRSTLRTYRWVRTTPDRNPTKPLEPPSQLGPRLVSVPDPGLPRITDISKGKGPRGSWGPCRPFPTRPRPGDSNKSERGNRGVVQGSKEGD